MSAHYKYATLSFAHLDFKHWMFSAAVIWKPRVLLLFLLHDTVAAHTVLH